MIGGRYLTSVFVLAATTVVCAVNGRPTLSPARMASLWVAPTDLERRDLFYGVGGSRSAPDPRARYQFLRVKATGTQPGYDVIDARGREWSVKMGVESRTEVVMSRLVWAIGYRQPYVYYLPEWTLVRNGKSAVQPGGRFRLEPATQKKTGEWSWRDNPFRDTRPLTGLFVLMVMVNNWDLKTAQNAVYEVTEDDNTRYWYMVRDLGAVFGRSAWIKPGTKDDPDGFDAEPFIDGVKANRVLFHYQGAWREPRLHASVTPEDVRWICGLLDRLSARQWSDAFRAGGYDEAEGQRYVRRLLEKIHDGLRLQEGADLRLSF
jgi:hypothetical protein